MKLTDRRINLLNFVITQHGLQRRKYNNDPYYFHLIRVGQMAEEYGVEFGFEKGLCHDLVEDPKVPLEVLTKTLESFGYHKNERDAIVRTTHHLTDVFTSDDYPDLNRHIRKKLEAERLWEIPADDQTVKYCDLIDNTSTSVPYDPKFAQVYLSEKRYILQGMTQGNNELFNQCKLLSDEQK